jgi:Tol biopolymer transport system component
VTPEDIVALRRPSDPQMSPDGTRVAFVVNEWDRREDSFTRELYVVDVKTGQMSRPTSASGNKRFPRWSPDGKSLRS